MHMHAPFNGAGESFKLVKSSSTSLCVRKKGCSCLQRLVAGLQLLVRGHNLSGEASLRGVYRINLAVYVYAVKPPIKDTLKENKPSNKGQATCKCTTAAYLMH